MSLSALERPLSDDDHTVAQAANGRRVEFGHSGYQHWLLWLQKLLSANALGLFAYHHDTSNPPLTQLAGWPDKDALGPWAMDLSLRAVKTRALVQATHKDNPARSVVCVPDVDEKCVKHILVIERNVDTKLDSQTQARLVVWAFESLQRYAVLTDTAMSGPENIKTRQSLDQPPGWSAAVTSFAQCALQLAELSGAELCVISKITIKREKAGSARLLAVSGQPRVDNRLLASRKLMETFDNAYKGKALRLLSNVTSDIDIPSTAPATPASVGYTGVRLMMPMMLIGQWFCVSLERKGTKPFSVAEQSDISFVSHALLGGVLLADPVTLSVRSAISRSARALRLRVMRHLPGYVAVVLVSIAALVYLLYPAEHRISAPLNVEAAERHVLIAPVDGFVQSVAVSAGDRVGKGQMLAALDDQELRLQLQKHQSDVLQNQQAYSRALAAHDRVEVTRLKEEGTLLKTELSRLNYQMEKMVLRAPVDGVVLSGSWDDFLGAAVAAGDTLFSLGSDSSHRLVLEISEYDVTHVRPGQAVAIRLAADPSTVLTGEVTTIMPLAIARAGINSVQVHARLAQGVQLRSGMQGIGKVLVGEKSRLMQWVVRVWARLVWLGWKLGVLR